MNKDVIVAVVDSGVDYTHPDLVNNMWVNELEKNGIEGVDDDGNGFIDDTHGYNFVHRNGDPTDILGHGTHVAGIIAATHNDFGIKGINPNAKVMALKALHNKTADPIFSANAIRYAVDNGASIINCSFVELKEVSALKEAVKYAISKGVIVVAAAGNFAKSIDGKIAAPAGLEGVITVANLTKYRELHSTSNFGKKNVLIAAPGSGIRSTDLGGNYTYKTGTSMAAPFVSGAISLLFSRNEFVDTSDIASRLARTGTASRFLRGKVSSGKRINVYDFIKD